MQECSKNDIPAATCTITHQPRDEKTVENVDDTNDDQEVTGEDKQQSSKGMKQICRGMLFSNSK